MLRTCSEMRLHLFLSVAYLFRMRLHLFLSVAYLFRMRLHLFLSVEYGVGVAQQLPITTLNLKR